MVVFAAQKPGRLLPPPSSVLPANQQVERLQLLTDPVHRVNRGTGFVQYATRSAAEDAIAALNGSYTVPGAPSPLVVKWSEGRGAGQKRKAAEDAEGAGRPMPREHERTRTVGVPAPSRRRRPALPLCQ